mgnify:CR=1 FL=1
MAKYEKGQTWPKGKFSSGLMLTYTDSELRKGLPTMVSKKEKVNVATFGKPFYEYRRRLVKERYFPAGKSLKTDTEIRRFRKKHIFGPHLFGGKTNIEWGKK